MADEGLLWYDSQRTALGELPIRDFFSYDPGRYYWSSAFFHLMGGNGLFNLLASNATFGALGLAAIWFAMCKARIGRKWRIAGGILLAIALGFPRHKVFEQSLSLIAVSAVFLVLQRPENKLRWLIYGILTGLAAVIGRNHGVFFVAGALLSGGVLFVSKSRPSIRPPAIAFIAGVSIGYSPMLVMLALKPGFLDAFISSILFTANWQLPLPIPFPWRVHLTGLSPVDAAQEAATSLACIVFPLIYALGLTLSALKLRDSADHRDVLTLLCASSIVGIPYLFQAFDRADFSHIAQAALPAFPAAISGSYFLWTVSRRRVLAVSVIAIFSIVSLVCWLPNEPLVKFARIRQSNPQSISTVSIDGTLFEVEKMQADLLSAVRQARNACRVGESEFMAAPYFPGVYAYLHAKAPFWELYYLYQRSPEFQRQHIAAISKTRLILLAPDAAVDGLERLKFKNTNGLLLQYIQEHYVDLHTVGLPDGFKLYGLPNECS